MSMLEFKLNYYFELYKDTCIIKTTLFKELFRKEHGDFPLLNELVVMIQRYQHQKYGELLESGKKTFRYVKKGTYSKQARAREKIRFGTKEERLQRKLNELRR